MKKTVKAEIKSTVQKTLADAVQTLNIAKPSKKTIKAIGKVEKALRKDLKSALKKEIKNATSTKRASKKNQQLVAAS